MQQLAAALTILFATVATIAMAPGQLHAAEERSFKAGDVPPQFVGRTVDDDEVKLELSNGKAYVVTFWASWCAPCLQELPILSNLQKKVGADKIQVIAVNIEDRKIFRRLRGPITDLGLTAAFDPNAVARRAFGVNAIPHMVVIGRDGKIAAVRKGYSEAKLETYVDDFNRALAAPLAVPN